MAARTYGDTQPFPDRRKLDESAACTRMEGSAMTGKMGVVSDWTLGLGVNALLLGAMIFLAMVLVS